MKSVLSIVLLLFTAHLTSQELGTIKGHIMDEEVNNAPLMLANITVKDADRYTETNLHGNFEMTDLPAGNYILTVRFAGYEDLEMPIEVKTDEVTQIQASLAAKSLNLDLASLLGGKDTAAEQEDSTSEKNDKDD